MNSQILSNKNSSLLATLSGSENNDTKEKMTYSLDQVSDSTAMEYFSTPPQQAAAQNTNVDFRVPRSGLLRNAYFEVTITPAAGTTSYMPASGVLNLCNSIVISASGRTVLEQRPEHLTMWIASLCPEQKRRVLKAMGWHNSHSSFTVKASENIAALAPATTNLIESSQYSELVPDGHSRTYYIPLAATFLANSKTMFDTSFLEPLTVRLNTASQADFGLVTSTGASKACGLDIQLRTHFLSFDAEISSAITTSNFGSGPLIMPHYRFNTEISHSTTNGLLAVANNDVNSFDIRLTQNGVANSIGVGIRAPPPSDTNANRILRNEWRDVYLPLRSVTLAVSGQVLFRMSGTELESMQRTMNSEADGAYAGSSDPLSCFYIIPFADKLRGMSTTKMNSVGLSFRELSNPVLTCVLGNGTARTSNHDFSERTITTHGDRIERQQLQISYDSTNAWADVGVCSGSELEAVVVYKTVELTSIDPSSGQFSTSLSS